MNWKQMNDSISEVNSVFEQPWWLDAVAPGEWDCILVRHGDEIAGRWPYVRKRSFFGTVCTTPMLTQTLGPWIRPQGGRRVKVLHHQKQVLTELAASFPKGMGVEIRMDSDVQYVLPFRWAGFRYEPHFSYRFSSLSDPDGIFRGFSDSRKACIRKAERELTVRDDSPIDVLIALQNKTYRRRGIACPIPESLIRRLDEACVRHDARLLLSAHDSAGRIHAACYFVHDRNRCYYIMSGFDPEYRSSGAVSLLLWEGIRRAAAVSEAFDFEGSENEGIEALFRSFGPESVCSYRLYRMSLPRLWDDVRYLLKRISQRFLGGGSRGGLTVGTG